MDVSIVIVSYYSREWLVRCLRSIDCARINCAYEVIVVDNGSTDGSVETVQQLFPHIRVVAGSENIGFGRAVNVGMQSVATGRFVLVLNPDVLVHQGAVEALLAYATSHPSVGLCAPRLLNCDGTLQYSCRTFYTAAVLFLRRTPLGRVWPDHPAVRKHLMSEWDHATPRDVDWVLGAAMLVRRAALTGDRMMDERFFLYFEDVDLCRRLHRQGWKVVYLPEAVMMHQHHRSSASGLLTRTKWLHFCSWLKFEWKYRVALRLCPARDMGVVPVSAEARDV